MEFCCCFCSSIEEEVPLIELSSNLLVVSNTHYEFGRVFAEVFGVIPSELKSNFVCETCKDQTTQFFVFKSSVENQVNRHRKMIMTQIQDFLSQCTNLEEIQVVRKLCSITLQIDDSEDFKNEKNFRVDQQIKATEPDLDECSFEEVIFESDQSESEPVQEDFQFDEMETESSNDEESQMWSCLRCGESADNSYQLEVHEFMKHSLLGVHIESDSQQDKLIEAVDDAGNVIKFCVLCSTVVEETAFNVHLIASHSQEIVLAINDQFDIDGTPLSIELINSYIEHIIALMSTDRLNLKMDAEVKRYFYSVYSSESIDNHVQAVIIPSDDDEMAVDGSLVTVSVETSKAKNSLDLSLDDRNWLRRETSLRKKNMKTDSGISRSVYRCAYCNTYVSNSTAGFRYHLISKHLHDKHLDELQEVVSDFVVELKVEKAGKNTCDECNLKLKDQKQYKSHQNCHQLFATIAHVYSFPACNTCNRLFIDERSLDRHLKNHKTSDDISQPIAMPCGAVLLQGKPVTKRQPTESQDDVEDNFAWNCGHCLRKFPKEFSCRYHLLMCHVSIFTCPTDKREFSGVKAVSLFCHHLQNKHPEMFPQLTFSCTFCKLEFSSIYEKLSHMKNCELKKFGCDHCGKKFFKKGELVSHMKFVSGEINYPCRVCNKRCETLSDLKIHLRSHTKEKPFECPLCTKSFRTLAARSAHTESHNTTSAYSCFCGKSFKQRQLYRRHVKAFHEKDSRPENTSKLQQNDEDSQ